MAQIQVESGDLHSTASQLKAASEQINQTSESAKRVAEQLTGVWKGTANAAFEQAMTQWSTGARQVDEALQRIGVLLSDAAQKYESTEQANTSMFG
jgi:WXG100 family type VII secretion target